MSPRLRLAALGAAVAAVFTVILVTGGVSADRLRDGVEDAGALAPVVFVLVSASLTVVLFPGPVLAATSGLLFGTALGAPRSLLAAVLGACAAFGIARRFGADAVEEIAGERLTRIKSLVERRGFLSVLYARLAPGVPYTIVNYACGLSRIRLRDFAAATTIGASPRAFAYTALGGSFGNFDSPVTIVAVSVLVVMALSGLFFARRDVRRERQAAA